jgi:hypothetical protein
MSVKQRQARKGYGYGFGGTQLTHYYSLTKLTLLLTYLLSSGINMSVKQRQARKGYGYGFGGRRRSKVQKVRFGGAQMSNAQEWCLRK